MVVSLHGPGRNGSPASVSVRSQASFASHVLSLHSLFGFFRFVFRFALFTPAFRTIFASCLPSFPQFVKISLPSMPAVCESEQSEMKRWLRLSNKF